MSGVVKIEISESVSTLKKLLINASSAKDKEKIKIIYWLKTKTVTVVQQIAIRDKLRDSTECQDKLISSRTQ